METKIHSSRLTLDSLTPDDWPFILSLVNTEGWLQYIGDRKVHSKEDALQYINKILHGQNIHYWVARMNETGTPVGIVTFLKRCYLNNFDIGFAFLPEFNGKGFAFEAASEVLQMLQQDPAYHPILATTVPQNEKSIRLLNKLGLHFEREIEIEKERLLVYSNA